MHSLYYVLTSQHREEVTPVRGNEQTVSRLFRYFEDIVTEPSALVIEGRCLKGEPSREAERLAKFASSLRRVYLFSCDTDCDARSWQPLSSPRLTTLAEQDYHAIESGPFIVAMEPTFCGLLASRALQGQTNGNMAAHEMVWTFDPNVVFTAIEYLLARLNVHQPDERQRFQTLLNASTPRSSSLRLALAFTNKVAELMQRQNELEMATNRISSAISGTLELESILQSAVEEVGSALNARKAALVLWQEGTNMPESMSIYERPEGVRPDHASKESLDDDVGQDINQGLLEVPISYRGATIGELVVEDDANSRIWEDEEVLMVRTASDQLAVAISHARLFRQVQTQAMTDSLTGLYNHRYFQERLDRETKLADRRDEPVSLILLDLDHLKQINDSHGHRSGDMALCHVAAIMRSVVSEVDVCARYGGEEFVVILPHCDRVDAIKVAERLRESIASSPVERVGQITASIGVATYPQGAKSKEELVEIADRAMYLAKAAGRNRVRTLAHRSLMSVDA